VATGRILTAALLAAGLLGASRPGPAGAENAPPGVGSYAPEFELADCGGVTRRLAWVDGGPAASVIFFFDPQSRESILEVSFVDALHELARDFGLAVWAVEARGRQPAEVSRAMERYCAVYRAPGFAILPDPTHRTGRVYGVRRVPTTFVTEQHGVIISRTEGFGPEVAVAVTRHVERLLARERGFFSEALRAAGVSAAEEDEIERRMLAAVAEQERSAARSRVAGDTAPTIEFADLGGRTQRWDWPGGGGARIVFFWEVGDLASVEAMTWLDSLVRRGREVGLETVAVEATGQDAVATAEAMERYRRLNPPPSFPVVADPGGRVVGAFGPFERLPQIYVVGLDGTILLRSAGFDAGVAAEVAGKVERAFALAGRPLPAAAPAGAEGTPVPAGGGEAPSISAMREREQRYRSAIVQADAYFNSWNFERAYPHYRDALELEPRDLHALERAAQTADRLGFRQDARDLWERVLALRPDHVEARSRLNELRR